MRVCRGDALEAGWVFGAASRGGQQALSSCRLLASHHALPLAPATLLPQGVEQLAKMAGDAKQLPTFEMSAPGATKDGATVVGLKFTRGLQRMTFTLTFRLQGGQITWLSNARS